MQTEQAGRCSICCAWPLSLFGLGLLVFAIAALSGPGRIDIVDGQTRFEVGRSLVEHGDSALRDERVWWGSFPGRDGLNFAYYRFPQSVAAAGSIAVADLTGPVSEGRRHFFFVLTSAAAAAILAIFYAVGFRALGQRPSRACLWALGGIVCTPNWFYSTSTFDDILGTTAVVTAAVVALTTRDRRPILGAIFSGLLMGLAYNCKQPLGAFVLIALALHDNASASKQRRIASAGIIVAGLLLGILVEKAYDYSKFPFDKWTVHAELLKKYASVYTSNPIPALVCFALSSGCGFLWYCPPVLLSLCGIAVLWKRGERKLVAAILLTTVTFIGFLCFLSFFKGDPGWGPRYLTPWYGMLWLFAPQGAAMLSRFTVRLAIVLGIVVQLLALAADPHRLYVEKGVPSSFGASLPWLYFNPEISQIIQRPREIMEMATDRGSAREYTPSPAPTFTFPIIDPPYLPEKGRPVVERYQVLRGFRPWWINQRFLPRDQRPVDLDSALWILGSMAIGGGLLLVVTARCGSPR